MEHRFKARWAEAAACALLDVPCLFLAALLADWQDPGRRLGPREHRRRYPPREGPAGLPWGCM